MTTIIIVNNNYYNYYKNKKFNYTQHFGTKKIKNKYNQYYIFMLKYTDKWIIIKNNH